MAATTTFNFSKTQRIVLLIDLHPFLRLQNPNSYLKPLLNSIKLLLSFTPLSNSLFSFKLFFSNLSPLRSSSSLPVSIYRNPNSLSFNCADETLSLLSKSIDSFVSNLGEFSSVLSASGSRGEYLSCLVGQVIHDYSWDSYDFDCKICDELGYITSNLIVLFSPVCRSFVDLRDFMGFDDDLMCDFDCFLKKFRGVFGNARDTFVSRDIHFSWVDVRYDSNVVNDVENGSFDERAKLIEWFRNGVKSLGWGFCSSDSIVLGSALVPFGLIYPLIGVSLTESGTDDGTKKICGELNLEILDVSGNPMECKFCDVQLIGLKMFCGQRLDNISLLKECNKPIVEVVQQSGMIWEIFGDEVVKIDVKSLYKCDNLLKFDEQILDVILVRELVIDSKRKKDDSSGQFFADRVIDLLSDESGWLMKRKSPPFWQILLSFMCRNDQCALIHLSNTNGRITRGYLKPSTIHSALLFVLKNDTDCVCGVQIGESKQNVEKVSELDDDMDSVRRVLKKESRAKQRRHRVKYKDLSWSSFSQAASDFYKMELEEAYFSKGLETSKKLKFLKCWMNQIAKYNTSLQVKLEVPINLQKAEERLNQSHQECQRPLPLEDKEHAVKESSQIKEARASPQEAAEAFFSNLSQRIQHGIASGVDLLGFAQRVVCSSIYWLRQIIGPDNNEGSLASLEKSDGSNYGSMVAGELVKILLRDPKDIARKNKDGNLSSEAPDGQLSATSSEHRVREYELQILFRMEILQSEIVAGIRDSAKLKLVKQICRFLEFIQCNMEDGFFGDFNLNDYVGRTIRTRYSQNLGDIVHIIYDQMDLLLFDDGENETPNLLLNSEDSSQSLRVGDTDRGSEPNSTDDSIHSGSATDHERKLAEAQERRARALRFSSFTRRAIPELQRVWAPKPPKLSRSKSDSFRRCKRKTRNRESYDTVCETPMSGPKKCLFPSDGSFAEKGFRDQGGSSSGSINRALFQDESWHQDLGL